MSARQIVYTQDGTLTCLDEETGELYHNRAGAYLEALENFVVPSRLVDCFAEKKALAVLDLPFGLGYNAFVLLNLLSQVEYPLLEHLTIIGFDIDKEIFTLLGAVTKDEHFAPLLRALPNWTDVLKKVETLEPCDFAVNGTSVHLEVRHQDIRKGVPSLLKQGTKFDAIFHDPFSANKMPELWTLELFSTYYALLKDHGRILTYSAAVAVRSALQSAGFFLYRTVALGEKSGGTLAARQSIAELGANIFPLSAQELARLKSRSAVPYRDQSFTNSRSEILTQRRIEQASWTSLPNN